MYAYNQSLTHNTETNRKKTYNILREIQFIFNVVPSVMWLVWWYIHVR